MSSHVTTAQRFPLCFALKAAMEVDFLHMPWLCKLGFDSRGVEAYDLRVDLNGFKRVQTIDSNSFYMIFIDVCSYLFLHFVL